MRRLAALFVFALLLVFFATLLMLRRGGSDEPPAVASATGTPRAAVSSPSPPPTSEEPAPEAPEYATLRLAVAGDLVPHDAIIEEARTQDGYDFRPMMESVLPVTERADIAVLCLEAALVESGYSGYPMFKAPDALAEAIADSGFDLVSTASNHALDGLGHGLARTLEVLDANNLAHVGTWATFESWAERAGVTILEENGISIAFLAYTYGTNGINIDSVGGHSRAVNVFARDYLTLAVYDIDYDRIRTDMSVAKRLGADVIAVFMHWGIEYRTVPDSIQTDLADFLIAEGADLILGGHPHVPEPLELRPVSDGRGEVRNVFLNYCMGNFISSMNDQYTKLTGIAEIEIVKNLSTGEIEIKDASYVPFYMADLGDFGAYSPDWRYRLLDLHGAIDAYDEALLSGADPAPVNGAMYQDMLKSLEELHSIFGKKYDSYYFEKE